VDKEFKNYPDIAPVMGAYSRATKVGSTFYMAGCTAGDSTAPLADQVRMTLEKIKGVLEAEGRSMADIVKMTTFVTDVKEWTASSDANNATFKEFFKGQYPPNTMIGCAALALPSMKVEIEATAVF
jgi:enamine deaminase RidA (YjgF/YER057c/UK114 family)